MNDVVKEFLIGPVVVITDEEILKRREDKFLARAALDAEREAHAKEVADLRQRIKELEAKLREEVGAATAFLKRG